MDRFWPDEPTVQARGSLQGEEGDLGKENEVRPGTLAATRRVEEEKGRRPETEDPSLAR